MFGLILRFGRYLKIMKMSDTPFYLDTAEVTHRSKH